MLRQSKRTLTQLRRVADMRKWSRNGTGQVHGFVPTMGALHFGHAHLVRQAKKHCDRVSVSIFVNPTQFGPTEDLDRYPRTLKQDLALLEEVGADAVFLPTLGEMYPRGSPNETGSFVTVEGLSHQLEGMVRPHFFRGVATVVAKLFNAVQPDVAFFGQKDIQQCCVIRAMVRDLLIPVEIKVCETQRDPDGLAMSSRNRYLAEEERKLAPILYRALMAAQNRFHKHGTRDRAMLLNEVYEVLSPAISDQRIKLDYVSLASPDTLEEVTEVVQYAHLSAAIRVGGTRLIDNIILGDDNGLLVR